MSVTLSLFAGAGAQFLDNNGNVLSGGLIYTYSAGTTTPLATYTSNLGTIAQPNPIVLDSAGRIPGGELWLTTGYGYKFVTKDANSVLIGTYDNVPSSAQPPITNDASSIAYELGTTVNAGAFIVGTTYLITYVGSTNFTLIGATGNTIGLHFIATGPGSGSGTAQLSRTVQSKLKEILSVDDFGADPTGITDSTAALFAMNAYCVANKNVFYVIEWTAGGTYKFTDNRWTNGIRYYRMNCNGATFINTNGTFSNPASIAYGISTNNQDYFENTIGLGYLINTTTAGTTSATLISSGDTSNFFVGCPVLIYGFEQYGPGGFPSDPKFFEYNEVIAINAGIITLGHNLKYNYRQDWPERTDLSPAPPGKARIMPLALASNPTVDFCLYAEWNDGIVLGTNPAGGYAKDMGLLSVSCCKLAVINNMTWNVGGPSVCDEVIYNNCKYIPNVPNTSFEIDKILTKVTYNNCDLYYLVAATGCSTLQINGSRIDGTSVVYGAKNKIIKDCDFTNSFYFANGSSWIMEAFYSNYGAGIKSIENCRFFTNSTTSFTNRDVDYGTIGSDVSSDIGTSFTVVSVTSSSTTTQIIIDDTIQLNFSKSYLGDGSTFYIQQASGFLVGKITSVAQGSQYDSIHQYVALNVQCNGIITAGEVFTLFAGNVVEFKNNSMIRADNQNVKIMQDYRYSALEYASTNKMTTDFYYDKTVVIPIYGVVEEITLSILKPYTGSDSNPQVYVSAPWSSNGSAVLNQYFDLSVKGTYILNLSSTPAVPSSYVQSITLYRNGIGGYLNLENSSNSASPDITKMPIVRVSVKYSVARYDF